MLCVLVPRRPSSRTASPVKMVEEQMDTREKVKPPSQSRNKRELNLADFESSQEVGGSSVSDLPAVSTGWPTKG